MSNTVIVTNDTIKVVSVAEQGPRGPQGDTGPAGADGAPGTPGDTILDKPITSPVLGGDLVPIIRGNSIYLATVADFLNAQGITPAGARFDFSAPRNSALFPFYF